MIFRLNVYLMNLCHKQMVATLSVCLFKINVVYGIHSLV